MNELINTLKDEFSAFVEVMLIIPSRFQIRYVNDVSEVVILIFILAVPMGVIFLCARLMKKYNLGFSDSVLLAFLVLSLTLGLSGLILSIPRLDLISSSPFLIIGIGSPVFNLVLGVIASLGHRLRNGHSKAGILLLFVSGLLFAYVLFTTITVFILGLYNY